MNRRVSTRWLIVAPTWLLMSSPMTGRPSSAKRRCQYGSRPMNTGIALMKPTPAWSACSTYHLVASSRADRQVRDHDVDLALLEDADDVGRRAGRLLDDLAEVLAEAVVGHAALDLDAEVRDLLEDVGVVRLRVDRLGQVLADLVLVDVEGGHELDVADVVAAEVDVHQPGDEVVVLGVLVVVAALDEAARAVADADDRDADLLAGLVAVRAVPLVPLLLTWCSSWDGLTKDVDDSLDDGDRWRGR